jgi:hypothetical protein
MKKNRAAWSILHWLVATMFLARVATAIDAAEWQLHSSHPPNKSGMWTYGIDLDAWMLAHDALRGEVHDFEWALETLLAQRKPLSRRQTRAMRRWWHGHLIHMRSHHRNEDKIVKAFIQQRFAYPDFMEMDHVQIERHLNIISGLIRWLASARSNDERKEIIDRLQKVFQRYVHQNLLAHLEAEEEIGIPLTRAFFTPKEVQRMTNRLARNGPRVETGAIVHYVGVTKLNRAMQLQKAPLRRLMWIFILNPRHRYYRRHMLASLNIISQQSR